MAEKEAAEQVSEAKTQVPEWEHTAAARSEQTENGTGEPRRSPMATASAKLNTVLPPHKSYLGLSRRTFLIVLLAVFLALLALVIGLAAGLTKGSNPQDLPLPSNAQEFTGDLTYYEPGLGACGEYSTSQDDIVAVSHILFDAAGSSSSDGGNSNDNPLCNKMLRASRFDGAVGAQRSIDLKVVDRCTGCDLDDLDTSLSAFTRLAPEVKGRVDVTWAWLSPVATGK